jgi:hypothetical protein
VRIAEPQDADGLEAFTAFERLEAIVKRTELGEAAGYGGSCAGRRGAR